MIYYATFTLLIDGATWGTCEEAFSGETLEEVFGNIKEWEEEHETKKQEFLLDLLETEEGEEIDTTKYYNYLEKENARA